MRAHERPARKLCTNCGKSKPHTEFYKSRRTCKDCYREQSQRGYQRNKDRVLARGVEYRKANKNRLRKYMADWYTKNRERVLERSKQYNSLDRVKKRERLRQAKLYAEDRDNIQAKRKRFYAENPAAKLRLLEYQLEYYSTHKDAATERVVKRNALKLKAFPAWADRNAIRAAYRLARQRTAETGIRHVVDHVVPLQGRKVCGLHVHNNLQVITEKENLEKFNKFA